MKKILNKKILILEPTIFVTLKKTKVLLYNSENGKKIANNSASVINFLSRNKHKYYHYFYIDNVLNKDIDSFIKSVTDNSFGFTMELINDILPIQFMPKIYSPNVDQFNIEKSSIKVDVDFHEVSKISIILDNESPIFNISDAPNNIELNFNSIVNFINTAKNSFILVLKGNILHYSYLGELLDFIKLNNKILQIHFYVELDVKDVLELSNKLIELQINYKIQVFIKNGFNLQYLQFSLKTLTENCDNLNLNFLVENEKSVTDVQNIKENIKTSISIIPSYNGTNMMFFEKYIFLTKNDILKIKVSYIDVLKQKYLNPIFFGKLTINNDGNVFANTEKSPVGNIIQDTINKVIDNEFLKGNSWLQTRDDVSPCKDCIYSLICPPISRYEYQLNRFNLCLIN